MEENKAPEEQVKPEMPTIGQVDPCIKRKPKVDTSRMYKEIKNLKKVKALLNNKSLSAAYREVYPGVKQTSAEQTGRVMLTPEIFEKVKDLLNMESVVRANKDVLEKILFLAISRWISGKEKTTDMIAAVRELTKLVPEFKDKLQVEDISTASEEELDRKLRGFGYDPNLVQSN
jgi:hypothetical protein